MHVYVVSIGIDAIEKKTMIMLSKCTLSITTMINFLLSAFDI